MAINLVLGIDAGLNAVKLIGPKGEIMFRSFTWVKPKRLLSFGDSFKSKDRFEITFEEETYLIGDDAYNTTQFLELALNEYSLDGSKNNDEALLRAISGICRYIEKYEDKEEDDVNVYFAYGSPILNASDAEEVEEIKARFKNDSKPFSVVHNDRELNISIKEIGIVPEGLAAYLSKEFEDKYVYIVDAGSMTINLAAIVDGTPIPTGAGTLTNGIEYYKEQYGEDDAAKYCAKSIINKIKGLKWTKNAKVYVCGGYTKELVKALKAQNKVYSFEILEPELLFGSRRNPKKLAPIFANAAGLYYVADQTFSEKVS